MVLDETKLRILSIDGGGIKGIIPGQVLIHVEKLIQDLLGDSNARLADYFDLIAGTSTGGILSCLYLVPDKDNNPKRPKYSAAEAVDLYLERGDEIFDRSTWQKIRSAAGIADEKYSADELEDALNDFIGDTRLSELLKPCLITSYDIRRRRAHFFNQIDAKKDKGHDFYVRDVARATSAAPTYFECHRLKSFNNITYPLIDGGLVANNPSLCAYAEARNMKTPSGQDTPKVWTAKDMRILSLGTGSSKSSYYYKEAKDWGMLQWIQPVIDIQMSAVAETVDYQLKMIYDAVEAPDQYLRIDCDLPEYVSSEMDDASTENMGLLRELGAGLSEQFGAKLKRFLNDGIISK